MSYYLAKTVSMPFDEAVARTTEALKQEGFGIITQVDIRDPLKQKIGVDFRPYRILGACNPALAHEALQIEDKVGTMLPCNVIVQEFAPGRVEVAGSILSRPCRPSTTPSSRRRRVPFARSWRAQSLGSDRSSCPMFGSDGLSGVIRSDLGLGRRRPARGDLHESGVEAQVHFTEQLKASLPVRPTAVRLRRVVHDQRLGRVTEILCGTVDVRVTLDFVRELAEGLAQLAQVRLPTPVFQPVNDRFSPGENLVHRRPRGPLHGRPPLLRVDRPDLG